METHDQQNCANPTFSKRVLVRVNFNLPTSNETTGFAGHERTSTLIASSVLVKKLAVDGLGQRNPDQRHHTSSFWNLAARLLSSSALLLGSMAFAQLPDARGAAQRSVHPSTSTMRTSEQQYRTKAFYREEVQKQCDDVGWPTRNGINGTLRTSPPPFDLWDNELEIDILPDDSMGVYHITLYSSFVVTDSLRRVCVEKYLPADSAFLKIRLDDGGRAIAECTLAFPARTQNRLWFPQNLRFRCCIFSAQIENVRRLCL